MSNRKESRILRVFLALLISFTVFAGSIIPSEAAAKAPKYTAKKNRTNVLKLLDVYDPDGAYIVRADTSGQLMQWFSGYRYLGDNMDTAVHETFHIITMSYYGDNMYLGNRKRLFVPRTSVFASSSISGKIPRRLRTFRYNTYMTKYRSNNMHSDINGPYGLLNEMAAYCWGMNTAVKLYPYYKKYGRLNPYYIACSNDKNAYAEFTYWILFYLDYAKNNNKAVYKGIMNNKAFKKIFKATDKKFRSSIKRYDKVANSDSMYYFRTKAMENDYEILIKEIKKNKYQKIYKQLVK